MQVRSGIFPRFGSISPFREVKLTRNTVDGVTLGYLGPQSKPVSLLDETVPEGTKIVTWPTFAIAAKTHPLQTYGMYNCCALRINSPAREHYLLHLPPMSKDLSEVQPHLEEDVPWSLEDDRTEMDLMPGVGENTAYTTNLVLRALYNIHPDLLDKVRFRHFPDEAAALGPNNGIKNPVSVVSYEGKLFYYPVNKQLPVFNPGGKRVRWDRRPV